MCMKKIFLSVLSLFVFVLISGNVNAQIIIKLGAGYGAGTQKMLLESVYSGSSAENIYESFGGNLGLFVAGGYEINQYVDFEVDLGYQHGRVEAIDLGILGSKTYVGRLVHIGPSLVFKTSVNENITPYGKLGVFTGIPLTKVLVFGSEKKFRGGLPFGYNGALGLDYNFGDTFKLFAEVYHQSMIYKPTRRKELDGTVVKLKDEIDIPTPSNQEISHHFFSFGALGLNLGVKIVL